MDEAPAKSKLSGQQPAMIQSSYQRNLKKYSGSYGVNKILAIAILKFGYSHDQTQLIHKVNDKS